MEVRAPTASTAAPLVFVEDDFPRAVAEAKRTGKPLFVDAWAPWCHTCLSMRALVLADPSLAEAKLRSGKTLREAFVWASIDTERVENTPFIAAHPNRVWPTLYVLSSDAATALVAWEGSATRDELVALLSDLEAGGGEARFTTAIAHAAAHRTAEARAALRPIVDDPRAAAGLRARALEALLALDGSEPEETIALVKGAVPWLPSSTSRATALAAALAALDELHRTDEPLVRAAKADASGTACASEPSCAALATDDRSGLYEALVAHAKTRGATDEAKSLAREWQSFLAEAARAAPSPLARYVYDAHRLLAAEAADDVASIVPVLEASARTFPDDGNTHARVARAYADLHRDDDAIREGTRATTLLPGPRALRAATMLADLYERNGRRDDARTTLESALRKVGDFPLTKSQRALAKTCEARAASLRR